MDKEPDDELTSLKRRFAKLLPAHPNRFAKLLPAHPKRMPSRHKEEVLESINYGIEAIEEESDEKHEPVDKSPHWEAMALAFHYGAEIEEDEDEEVMEIIGSILPAEEIEKYGPNKKDEKVMEEDDEDEKVMEIIHSILPAEEIEKYGPIEWISKKGHKKDETFDAKDNSLETSAASSSSSKSKRPVTPPRGRRFPPKLKEKVASRTLQAQIEKTKICRHMLLGTIGAANDVQVRQDVVA